MQHDCVAQAAELKALLERHSARIVLAESCTAGRVAATLGCLPGISNWLCGSFVVYRCDSKTRWLGVPAELLDDPAVGPVSQPTTEWLARAALLATPEARYGLAVTGEIGPGAPPEKDGLVFCSLWDGQRQHMQLAEHRLQSPRPSSNQDVAARIERLDEASLFVLTTANQWISSFRE